MEYPSYITNTKTTSAEYLYSALGSFWTSLFSDKDTLKGYTLGQAEEIIQRYQDFVEIVNSFSIDNCTVWHTENWKPLVIYKSQVNRVKFVFADNDAVFGPQPASDAIYNNVTFRFGKDKQPSAEVYTYQPSDYFNSAAIISDKLIDPTIMLVRGIDYNIDEGIFYFNKDPFTLNIPTSQVINEDGQPATFITDQGTVELEERLILWLCSAEIDKSTVYNNFGSWVVDIQTRSSQEYKQLIDALMKIAVHGPTMYQLMLALSAFLEIPLATKEEVIEQIVEDSYNKFVVTSGSVYKVKKYHNLREAIQVGYTLKKGEVITTNLATYDSLSRFPGQQYTNTDMSFGWWTDQNLTGSLFNLSKYLFYGDYMHQLAFSTEMEIVSLNSSGDVVFPVSGSAEDVNTFLNYINQADNKSVIMDVFKLNEIGDTYPLIPLSFVMENFLKNNTILIKFDFESQDDHVRVLSLLPYLREYLPPYCYCIYKLSLAVAQEVVDNFDNCTTIEFTGGTQTLNCDGSNEDGTIEKLAPYNYNDIETRLFELARQIIVRADEDLYQDFVVCGIPVQANDPSSVEDAIDEVATIITAVAVTEERFAIVSEGKPTTAIPTGATTANYSSLLLLDFS